MSGRPAALPIRLIVSESLSLNVVQSIAWRGLLMLLGFVLRPPRPTAASVCSPTIVCSLLHVWPSSQLALIIRMLCCLGFICSFSAKSNQWERDVFHAHSGGVNAVSWAPGVPPAALLDGAAAADQRIPQRVVTGGCDKTVRTWR
jgi:hypothetical protein